MNSAVTLTTLVEAALVVFPALAYKDGGSRADAAAALITEHKVNFLGVQFGLDWWEINQQRVSIKNGSCTCTDRGAPVAGKARLCKHMLAAMLTRKLEIAQQALLTAIFLEAPGDKVVLKLDVFGKGRDLEYWLCGFHWPGKAWETFCYDERRHINQSMLDTAIQAGGFFQNGPPSKQPGFVHHYQMVRIGSDVPRIEGNFTLSTMTYENVRRFDQAEMEAVRLSRVLAST